MSAPDGRGAAKGPPLWLRVLLWGLVYSAIGFLTTALTRRTGSHELVQVWRLASWAVSLGVFAACFTDERRRAGGAPLVTARNAALPVALGGFVLAVIATVRRLSMGGVSLSRYGVALVAWPGMLFVASFLVAWAAAALLPRKTDS